MLIHSRYTFKYTNSPIQYTLIVHPQNIPPKKKRIDSSQLQLSFGKDNSQEMCLVQSTEDAATAGTTSTSTTNRRGSLSRVCFS